jgi:hypothetical protein
VLVPEPLVSIASGHRVFDEPVCLCGGHLRSVLSSQRSALYRRADAMSTLVQGTGKKSGLGTTAESTHVGFTSRVLRL